MAGLELTAGGFFTFYLFIVLAQATMTVLFRTIGCVSANLDSALRLASVLVMLLILTSGYMVPYKDIRPWIRWANWINPLAYGFAGMMVNEFKDLDMLCVEQSLVPRGTTYNDTTFQVCILAGSQPQKDKVAGTDYLSASFGYQTIDLWRNVGVLIAFFVGLLGVNVLVGELMVFTSSTTYAKSQRPRKTMLVDAESNTQTQSDVDNPTVQPSQSTVTWENLDYTIPVGSGTKQLLYGVSGFVEPGMMLALMGPSGAGKSTLLDVLSQRKSIGVIEGDLMVDSKPPGSDFAMRSGYCEQADVHDSQQTVREAMLFSANLRQPHGSSQFEKGAYVDQLIKVLELTDVSDSLIGSPDCGLSIEERKRVTIGVELAAKPDILVFLDEPTSGLDSQSALSIVRFLRRLADTGVAIICTIHQPSASLFGIFDQLLLLHHGRTVYCGSTTHFPTYLSEHGLDVPPSGNVAEIALQALGETDTVVGSDKYSWAEKWSSSAEAANIRQQIQTIKSRANPTEKVCALAFPYEFKLTEEQNLANQTACASLPRAATPFWYQLRAVLYRTLITNSRLPGYWSTRLFNHILIGLLTGLTYLKIGNSLVDVQYRIFVVFQVTILPSLLLSQVEPRYHAARAIFYREKSSKMYSSTVFVSSMILSEIPASIVCSAAVSTTSHSLLFPSSAVAE